MRGARPVRACVRERGRTHKAPPQGGARSPSGFFFVGSKIRSLTSQNEYFPARPARVRRGVVRAQEETPNEKNAIYIIIIIIIIHTSEGAVQKKKITDTNTTRHENAS